MTQEEEMAAMQEAAELREILNQPIVKEAFMNLSLKYFDTFRSATIDDDRRDIWACSKALKDIGAELQIVIDRGEFAQELRARREKAEAAQKERSTR